ncbi:hypothetical protein KLP40_11205 [Hymenobacter sp. NST-14]|uniref:hypothetical protein n=1 Tax=Hymenobacter piscis TaxID=2839984 RepID=UPI001C01ADBD|nr:hypothetical protein [Hymenobacter piscis]MBT9393731.1 hypothetical protein [Hymenobacter piscis]
MAVLFSGLAAWVGYYGEVVLLIPALLLALFYGTGKRLLEIDPVRRRYRVGMSVGGFLSGRSYPLPDAQRVILRILSESDCTVLLAGGSQLRAQQVLSSTSYRLAFQVACFLGELLRVPVLEYDRFKRETVLQEPENETPAAE